MTSRERILVKGRAFGTSAGRRTVEVEYRNGTCRQEACLGRKLTSIIHRVGVNLVRDEEQVPPFGEATVREQDLARIAEPERVVRVRQEHGRDLVLARVAFAPFHLGVHELDFGEGVARFVWHVDARDPDLTGRVQVGYEAVIVRCGDEPRLFRVGDDGRDVLDHGAEPVRRRNVLREDGLARVEVGLEVGREGLEEAVAAQDAGAVGQVGVVDPEGALPFPEAREPVVHEAVFSESGVDDPVRILFAPLFWNISVRSLDSSGLGCC